MIKCPHCNIVMNEVIKVNIKIDVCSNCMGIWLDKGELEKIIEINREKEYQNSNEESMKSRNYSKLHYDDHDGKDHDERGYTRKRRGGLGEIFGNLLD